MSRHFFSERRNRTTGTIIVITHGDDEGLDTVTDGPWYTICDDHHEICSFLTLAEARSHAADPLGWCEGCRSLKGNHDGPA
jgi:hypothetical protein